MGGRFDRVRSPNCCREYRLVTTACRIRGNLSRSIYEKLINLTALVPADNKNSASTKNIAMFNAALFLAESI